VAAGRLDRFGFVDPDDGGRVRTGIRTARQDYGSFDKVFELAHIAWPGIFRQDRHCLGWNRRDLLVHPASILLHEMADEQGDVFAALAQGWDNDGKDIQPVIEIAAELFVDDHCSQIGVGDFSFGSFAELGLTKILSKRREMTTLLSRECWEKSVDPLFGARLTRKVTLRIIENPDLDIPSRYFHFRLLG